MKNGKEVGSSNTEITNKEKEKMVEFERPLLEKVIPKAGMVFNSEEEVYSLYVEYARQEGFGIAKKSTKVGDDGKLKYYALSCVRGGKRISTAKSVFNPRLSTKTNCEAKINIIVGNNGCFTISSVNLEHNHALSPHKARFQRCNKKMDAYVRKRLDLNDQAGIGLSKNFHSLAVESGGYENLTYTEKDCRNYIAKARQFRLGMGDAKALGNYFSRMQQRNSNFFHLVDMDEEGRLRNVFWADARSIAAYEAFSDVVSFDTTYLTNKYDMPFAPFVGVNHHGQTILFGCGLLSKEDTQTYIWLFNELEFDIKCTCRLFEFKGIVCRHICKVFIERNVKEIPSQYILSRWRKDIKRRHTYVKNCYEDSQISEQKVRYNKLCSHFSKAAEIGVESIEKYSFLMKCVDDAIEKLMDNANYLESHSNQVMPPMLLEKDHDHHQATSSKFLTPLKSA
ncbi:protein FAR1-RELATED SEQUENCE 5-like [Dioscorea cayenensis subsp. rotundata]|uniref:Protein FAR1-RELATED SEQUENCE 5-like n=1 Tax=Dioscorea cayennensis subsp. rotundata TaxID=55577 RepID=A0AB40BVP1_DIOCR|nr:protein FAR1-RELATED SEQUENCE 5-like [Dioscorea cayenensis subsp. rotundata]